MISLLIVDDEKIIRKGLQSVIERQFPYLFRYRFAENGQEALELLRQEPADIMFTDIRMPIMDGIELLEQLQDHPVKPEVVLLSGYNDFAYAQKAIRCAVKDYLIKPVKRGELFAVLERIMLEIRMREERADAADEEASLSAAELVTLHLTQKDVGDALTPDKAGLSWLDAGYTLGLLTQSGAGSQVSRSDAAFFKNQINELFQGDGDWLLTRDGEGGTILIARDPVMFYRLAERLRGSESQLRIAISDSVQGLEQIRWAYSQAKQTLKYRILLPERDVLDYASISERNERHIVPVALIRRLLNLIGMGRGDEIKQLLDRILDVRVISSCEIGYLERISQLLNEELFDELFRIYGHKVLGLLRTYAHVGHIGNFDRFEDYYIAVEQLLDRLDRFIQDRGEKAPTEPNTMQKVVAYLQTHYANDLNMAVVSNHFSLNYSYFSQAFQEYSGESFSNYVRRLRLDKAKELLVHSDLKVYEISEQVGFENVKHFTRLFKDTEGITALEFRNQRRQKVEPRLR
ncbi:two-component system response regulator YesN [Paenibacillus phyllosphaerae]|uniref:Two-component system response regulator YesN n=1 Tax=Paenibacillus phyllosphaerae TaxID=274593 RepID=A0A7W5ASM2_9BACL|nr:response regulator [Paenibacillus phyllosphaerae]MBB3108015.1 two-component system response regulator YesN [Paenibacillus phyllosphaerae]